MYQAVYKCRLCGEDFFDKKIKARRIEDFIITNTLAQMEQTVLIGKLNHTDLHRLHNCKDDSFGFADFQGFKKTEVSTHE